MSSIICRSAGIQPTTGCAISGRRRGEYAQKSYLALFEPELPGHVTAIERYAVATFVAGLRRQPNVTEFYAASWKGTGTPG